MLHCKSDPTAALSELLVVTVVGVLGMCGTLLIDWRAKPLRHAVVAGLCGGILYGVAFMHLLDDAQTDLSSSSYPWANMCFLVGAGGVALIDAMTRRHSSVELPQPEVLVLPQSLLPSHSNAVLLGGDAALQRGARRRAWVIQAAVAWHSFMHGLSLCIFSDKVWQPSEVHRRLGPGIVAFSAHQLLQGLALGYVQLDAGFGRLSLALGVCCFALAFPLGYVAALVAGGSSALEEGGLEIGQGVLSGIAAGSLACVASVDMVLLGKAHQGAWKLKPPKVAATIVGVGLMCVVALVD